MKRPQKTPKLSALLSKHSADIPKILNCYLSATHKDHYIHWDKLRHLQPPCDLSTDQWWLGIKLARQNQLKQLSLKDIAGNPFVYMLPDAVLETVHKIDTLGNQLFDLAPETINKKSSQNFNLMIEEAITSSQLEGASTTRKNAVNMIREQRKPKDHSEVMIMNNHIAMQQLVKFKDEPMSFELLMEMHRTLTINTLDDHKESGRLQSVNDERVQVVDNKTGNALHTPPNAKELPDRIKVMLKFANSSENTPFIHPIIKAIILHFWLAYEHPFVDGNGRTARALFYWLMLREGYHLFEYLSISRILKQSPVKYSRAFVETETDENDLTYFICYQLGIIEQAIQDLQAYLQRKTKQIQETEKKLRQGNLNHREINLLSHALKHPDFEYSIKSHQTSNGIAYATARADLLNLTGKGWLIQRRIGEKTLAFRVADDLASKMK